MTETVNNQQMFRLDNHYYSAPHPNTGMAISIIAYSFSVESKPP